MEFSRCIAFGKRTIPLGFWHLARGKEPSGGQILPSSICLIPFDLERPTIFGNASGKWGKFFLSQPRPHLKRPSLKRAGPRGPIFSLP